MCSRDQGSQEPMEGPVWAYFMALPLPHTPTINNDLYFPKQFLLFHTSAPLYMLFFLPEMTFSSWQTLPPHRLSWRVSSSMECTISPKADFSLLWPPQTWCPSPLTAHTAVTSMSLTGPWSFLVKWNKWMNDDGDHYDLAHTKVPTPSSVATPSDGHGQGVSGREPQNWRWTLLGTQ